MSDGPSELAKIARNQSLQGIINRVASGELKVSPHGVGLIDASSTPSSKEEGVNNNLRPSWPETWMAVARSIAERSYDPRLKVGCVIVPADNTSVLGIGYNGNYKGGPHTHESAEPGKSGFTHAEINALVKCDFNFPKKKHMYVTHSACRDCSKLIINAEIARVVYGIPYRDVSGLELLRSVGIEVLSIEEAIELSRQ